MRIHMVICWYIDWDNKCCEADIKNDISINLEVGRTIDVGFFGDGWNDGTHICSCINSDYYQLQQATCYEFYRT